MATATRLLPSGIFDPQSYTERNQWAAAWRRLRRNYAALLSIVVIAVFVAVALFAPMIATHHPSLQTSNNSMRLPVWLQIGDPHLDGRAEYPLGTDQIGRDVFAQLIYGSRVSLIVGIIPPIFMLLIGVTVGLIAGFAGGHIDMALMRFTDIVYAFPDLLFIITIATAFRETWLGQTMNGLLLVFISLALVSWTGMARLVRGQVLSIREKEFVAAARAIGVPAWRILLRHILPNTLAPIIVSVTFSIPAAIVAEAALSFIGVGMRPSIDFDNPFPTSWGIMLIDGYNTVSSNLWMLFFPALCVGMLTASFTFLGDGLRDVLDPRDQ